VSPLLDAGRGSRLENRRSVQCGASVKLRLDKILVERSLAPTRTRAQERIAIGQVSVDGVIVTKAGFLVDSDQVVEMHGEDLPYVSRGGLKLAAALDAWEIDVSGRICVDIGISTGGFSDCMLQRGAALVIGIDSGHSQLASALQGHPRLRLLESTNARYLTASMLPGDVSFFAMDVSFIGASLVLPAVIASTFPTGTENQRAEVRQAVILVKPQYEAGREFVGKHGIVRNEAAHRIATDRVRDTVMAQGAQETHLIDSPIAGGEGNREFCCTLASEGNACH
jgi:23S rRNA (cytidine1920-2'-O)/16S rRNA (cytidine1409-2'-O)-methyltransferase